MALHRETDARVIGPALQSVQAQYREMPGLRLTLRQAERLFGLDTETARTLFDALVELGFVSQATDGTYIRAQPR